MGICNSSPEEQNPLEVDLTHFDVQRVVGKGGFGKVNAVIKYDQPGVYYAMKRMEKAKIVADQSIDSVWTEREIMRRVKSPFVCDLKWAFQDDVELFFVMPFMSGGDLRFHLAQRGRMTEKESQFYAAEMCLGLEAIHAANISYRDLKPDNTLLDAEGHLMLSDFGIAAILEADDGDALKSVRGRAGTRGYQAPELLNRESYQFLPDFWSFGITVYELLHGQRPFKSRNTANASETPSNDDFDYTQLQFSQKLSSAAKNFISSLLEVDHSKRLGFGPGGWKNVKSHPFFDGIDWAAIKAKTITPPVLPNPDKVHFPVDHMLEDQLLATKPKKITEEQQKIFKNFNYNTEIEQKEEKDKDDGLEMSLGQTHPSVRELLPPTEEEEAEEVAAV